MLSDKIYYLSLSFRLKWSGMEKSLNKTRDFSTLLEMTKYLLEMTKYLLHMIKYYTRNDKIFTRNDKIFTRNDKIFAPHDKIFTPHDKILYSKWQNIYLKWQSSILYLTFNILTFNILTVIIYYLYKLLDVVGEVFLVDLGWSLGVVDKDFDRWMEEQMSFFYFVEQGNTC